MDKPSINYALNRELRLTTSAYGMHLYKSELFHQKFYDAVAFQTTVLNVSTQRYKHQAFKFVPANICS